MFTRFPVRSQRSRRRCSFAFTLIEVLVVVAIIALLVAVLLPSLARAREQGRAAVCLSNLHQQGIAFNGYSADNKTILPWGGSFRFSLMEGKYYLGWKPTDSDFHDWTLVNLGPLYPKYVGNDPRLFYCPNNRATDSHSPNGMEQFMAVYNAPRKGQPGYQNSHTFPISPMSSYCYGAPLFPARSPRDAGSKMYPDEAVRKDASLGSASSPYWQYLTEPTDPVPQYLGASSPESRGRHSVHALVADGYFSGKEEYLWDGKVYSREPFEGYHLQSYNVLFGDFHTKRVLDPQGQIHAAKLTPIRYTGGTNLIKTFQIFKAWDYFSRNP